MAMKKIAFMTTATKSFLPYLRALLNSITINSPSVLDIPMICWTGDWEGDQGLSNADKRKLKALYPSIVVKQIGEKPYVNAGKSTAQYWRYEMFADYDYDRVIFLDADLLCLKDISGLTEIDCDIGTTEQSEGRGDWNWGVFIVGKKYMTRSIYNQLMAAKPNKALSVQEPMHILTRMFRDVVYRIPQTYNQIVPPLKGPPKDAIIHYIYKPLTDLERLIQPEYLELWQQYSV
jgi:hypothetical protein